MVTKLTKKPLTEATVNDIAKAIDAETVVTEDQKFEMESALDDSLKAALRNQRRGGKSYPNIMFIGEGGVGKTTRIEDWARANNVNLVKLKAATMEVSDLGGIPYVDKDSKGVVKLPYVALDKLLSKPRSVLFLDELNRASSPVQATLLTLIQDHELENSNFDGNVKKYPEFLFTVAAVNPPTGSYDVNDTDSAMDSRFRHVEVPVNKASWKQWFTKIMDAQIKDIPQGPDATPEDKEDLVALEGQKKLGITLISDKNFRFDDAQETDDLRRDGIKTTLNNRTFTELLNVCDGTKADLLAKWNQFVNPRKKDMAEMILSNYVDVDDKANDALKGDSESPVFKKAKTSALDRLNSYKNKL